MENDLAWHLQSDLELWAKWAEAGVTESTRLTVDFNFYATDKLAACRLAAELDSSGYTTEVKSRRTFLIFRGWTIWFEESGTWSVETLHARSRAFCQLGDRYNARFEGCGAMMPSPEKM